MKHSAKRSQKVTHRRTGRFTDLRRAAPQRSLLSKIQALPPEKIAEVEDFIDFLRQRQDERALTHAATKLAEGSFEKVWDNPDDAAYDQL